MRNCELSVTFGFESAFAFHSNEFIYLDLRLSTLWDHSQLDKFLRLCPALSFARQTFFQVASHSNVSVYAFLHESDSTWTECGNWFRA